MTITPQTDIFILKSPLSLSNKHQITFASKEAQFEYFYSLPKLEIDGSSYQRKNEVIRYPAHIDSIIEYNYCMYQNENYSNKWFYAFITGMRYINDGLTEISITTDVFQTWQFDLIYKQSFVEREMINVNDDIAGANLLPEGLETGEFKIDSTSEIDDLDPITVIAYSGEQINVPSGTQSIYKDISQNGFYINGIPTTVPYILATPGQETNRLIGFLSLEDNSEHVVASFTVPKLAVKDFLIEDNSIFVQGAGVTGIYKLDSQSLNTSYTQTPVTKNFTALPNSLDSYTPRNQKLRTYPYIYLGCNPPNGSQKIYRYEDFTNSTPIFKVISEVNPNPSIHFIPQNYRGNTGNNIADSTNMNGYPTIASRIDTFNVWLAQNSEIINLQMAQEQFNYEIGMYKSAMSGFENIAGNAMLNNPYSTIKEGVNLGLEIASLEKNHEFYVKNQMAQIEKQKMLPDKVNLGSSATLLGYDLAKKDIFARYTIKRQFAERIDKYFDMYGYLTNTLKIPNLNNRPNWNYVKLQGANILGNIPQEDLHQIKEFFNNGITLWHNTSNFLDYSVNNR